MIKKKISQLLLVTSAVASTIPISSMMNTNSTNCQSIDSQNNNSSSYLATQKVGVARGKVINVSTNLRIRENASIHSNVLGYLYDGNTFEIKSSSGNWYELEHNGVTGYVSKDYVEVISNGSTSSPVSTSSLTGTGKVINVSSSLRLREAPSTSSRIIRNLSPGQTFSLKGKSGDWYYINVNGNSGYVHSDYVSLIGGSATTEVASHTQTKSTSLNEHGQVTNVSTSLRIRSNASLNSTIVGSLKNGTNIDIIGKTGDWYHINANGQTGYVHSSYVKLGDFSQQSHPSQPSSNKVSTNLNETGYVVNVSTNLRIRSGASTSSSIVGYLINGQNFNIQGRSGEWYYIKCDDKVGYIHSNYVKIGHNSSSTTQATSATKATTTTTNNSTQSASGYGKVINISTNLRIRSGASTNSSILGYLVSGDTFSIQGKSGDWYYIKHDDKVGYIHKDYVSLINESNIPAAPSPASTSPSSTSTNGGITKFNTDKFGMVVNVSTNLRLRSAANSSSSTLAYLLPSERFKIIGESGSWYYVNCNGKIGFVSKSYVQTVTSLNGNSGQAHNTPSSSSRGEQTHNTGSSTSSSSKFGTIISVMKQQLGSPYVWGGSGQMLTDSALSSLRSQFGNRYSRASGFTNIGFRAFDCSGLMQWGFRQAGISIGRTTWDQINCGREVSINSLQPGDLLFYKNLQHVGMYIGNGQWIEAPNSRSNVRITSVPWSSIGRARRVL